MDIGSLGMSYNIFFDIAAILNLIIVIFAFLIHKKLPEQKTKTFLFLCVSTLCCAIVDIISALSLNGVINVSVKYLWSINILYYFFDCSISFIFSFYCMALAECFHLISLKQWKFLLFVPATIQLLSLLTTPGFHFIFSITPDGTYVRGAGCYLLFGIMVYQVAIGLGFLFFFKENTEMQTKLFCSLFVVFSLIGVVLQLIKPHLLVQQFSISVSLLLVYTSFQTKEIITDSITGLLNLKSFNLMMNVNFKRRMNFSIVSIHLEDFSFLSNTFGIEGMNSILLQISEFLQSISSKYSVYQLEPDLYAVVIPDVSPVHYSHVTASVVKRFSKPWNNDLLEMKIGVRQCVVRCPHDATSNEMIADTINTARLDARYKNDKLLFADNIDVSTRRRYTYIEQLVKTAIQEHRIMVYYQPLIDCVTKKIVGAEALIRMKDLDGNFISPEEFVPIAEQDGFILRLGLYVYEEVCRFISSNRLMDYNIQMIDVNLSVAQCMQTRISEEFYDILQSYGLPANIINLEITETATAHTPELLYSNMNKFNKMGFNCSLDDYGTGYANLSYMLHMPFNMIKIDKEIVWGAMSDEKAYVMLVCIMDMMRKLGLKTVAEGIENEEMAQKLIDLKCDYLQGFYYSRPIPEKDFMELLYAQNADVVQKKMQLKNQDAEQDQFDSDISDLEELEEV